MCWVTGKTGGGAERLLGSGRTTGVCPTSRVRVRRFCTHARAGVAWCPCLCWTALTVCALSFVCLDSRPSKENRRPSEHEDGPATGRRRALLVCATACYHLLFPVKTGKDRGENGGSVCWLQVRLCLTVTLLARNNRPFQGVTHDGVLGVIFITFFFFFTKHSMGCFSQLLTQLWVISVFKTVRHSTERDSSPACSNSIGREPHMAAVSV